MAAYSAAAYRSYGGGLLNQALNGAYDLSEASATDDRAATTISPFTLADVASGTVISDTTAVGGRVACDDAATNLLANAALAGTIGENTPTSWNWGGTFASHGRRWTEASAESDQQRVRLQSANMQPNISQTVSGLTISDPYTVGVFVENFDCIAPHLLIGVDGAAIDKAKAANGFTGWIYATFTATATSHTISIGQGISVGNTGETKLSMPFMVAGSDPTVFTASSRASQTLTWDAAGLIGEAISSSYEIMTAEWAYDGSEVSVSFATGAGQTEITLTPGAASVVLVKEGGWPQEQRDALTEACEAAAPLKGYSGASDPIPGYVEWGDSTTAAGQDESIDVPSAMQASMGGITISSQGVGGDTSAQILARQQAASADDLRPWVTVINAGANDVNGSVPTATIMSNIASMVAHIGHDRYLIRTPLRNTTWNATLTQDHADLIADIQAAYPNNIVPVYETIGDNFKDDAIHLNSEGYQVVANLIQAELEARGWLSAVHAASVDTPLADAWASNAGTDWTTATGGQRLSADDALREWERNSTRLGTMESYDFILPFAGSDLTSCLVPLKGAAPTNNGFTGGDYSELVGLSGDGSSYLDSGQSVSDTGGYTMMVYGQNLPLSGAEQAFFANDERFDGVPSGQYFGLLHFGNLQRYSPPAVTTVTSQFARQTLIMSSNEDDGTVEVSGNGAALKSSSVTRFNSPRSMFLFAYNRGGTPGGYMNAGDMWLAAWGSAGIPMHKHLLQKRANNLLARRLGRLSVMSR